MNLIQLNSAIESVTFNTISRETMKCGQSVIVQLITLFYSVRYASSIFCYDCNSAFDPRCGENFDSFSLGVVNCSLRDQPDHLEPMEPTLCRTIKMDIYGKMRVVRTCGYLRDTESNATCRRVVGTGDLFTTYCTCDTDLCNGAVTHNISEMTLFSIIAVTLLF